MALYRFERDGWTIQDVAAEMRRQTYREGWLPGYVFGMVKERPGQELFEPAISRDRNLAAVVRTNYIRDGAQEIPLSGFEPQTPPGRNLATKNATREKETTDVR